MLEAVRACLTKYAVFSGRARRSEYWWWFLATTVTGWVIGLVVGVLVGVTVGVAAGTTGDASGLDRAVLYAQLIAVLLTLPLLLPSLAVGVRRLHDTGRTGWWWLLAFVPFGAIVLLVFFCQDSKTANRYGPNPKGGIATAYPYQPYYPR